MAKKEEQKYRKFYDYLNSGYPCIWVTTQEDRRAIAELKLHAKGGFQWYAWDIASGFQTMNNESTAEVMEDPLEPLQRIEKLPEQSVIFLKDYHMFIKEVSIFRKMKNLVPVLESMDKHIVIISPVDKIPIEIETEFVVWDFPLPTKADLRGAASKLAKDNNITNLDEGAAEAAAGMCHQSALNAFSLSLVTQGGKLVKSLIEEQKRDNIRRCDGLEWFPKVSIDEVGGLDNLKEYLKSRMRGFSDPKLPIPHGILLVGLPGAGKSLSAKMAAHIFKSPLVRLDLAALKGSLVGETEAKTRKVLQVIDANAPLVVWINHRSTLNFVNCWNILLGNAKDNQQPSLKAA